MDKTIEAFKLANPGKTMTYVEARTHGINDAREVNPACSADCLQAQLDAHSADKLKCKGAKLMPHSGMKAKKPKAIAARPAAPSFPAAASP